MIEDEGISSEILFRIDSLASEFVEEEIFYDNSERVCCVVRISVGIFWITDILLKSRIRSSELKSVCS